MKNNQYLEQLHQISLILGTTLDLAHEAAIFMEWLSQTVEPALAALFITDEAKQELRLMGTYGFEPPAEPCLSMGLDLWRWLAEQGAPVPEEDDPRRYAVPIPIERQLFGTLCLVSRCPTGQLAGEQRLVKTAASYLASVLRNIHRYQTLEQRVAERTAALSALNAVAAAVSQSLDLEETVSAALDATLEATGFEVGGIALWDEEKQRLQLMATRGVEPQVLKVFLGPLRAGGHRERVLCTGRPVFHDDTAHDPTVNPEIARLGFTISGMAPLAHKGKVLGLLAVATRVPRQWTEEEKSLLTAVGQQIAVAVANAQLYDEMRRSEEKYRSLVNTTSDLIFTVDVKGNILFANPAVKAFTGYEPQEITGHHFSEYIYQEDIPILLTGIQQVLDGEPLESISGVGQAAEYRMVRRDGEIIWVQSKSWPVRDAQGKIVGFSGITRDITERKRVERVLQALNRAALAMERAVTEEKIFSAVVEELKELGFSCILFSTDESKKRLIPKYLSYEASVLKTIGKLTGLKAEDLLIPIETIDAIRKAIWERKTILVENTEEIIRQLLPEPAKRFAGQIVSILRLSKAIVAPLIVEDETIGMLSVRSDEMTEEDIPAITAFAHQMAAAWRKAQLMRELKRSLEELKLTQAQLLQAQKLESLGRLVGGIAHDFNNLLTPIRGFASLMLMDTPQDDPRYQDLQRIITAADRAAGLTRQLTLFSRQEAPKRQPLRLNRIVEETHALLKEAFPRHIEIKLALEPKVWTIEADPTQISQVLMNLCINARDAMPKGGLLTLETRNVTLDEEYVRTHIEAKPGPYVRLSVSDTGIGMSEEVQSHLFEPFFTTKEVGKGVGLGLSTVYGIVKGHEGFITVHSEVGKGSTFHVYLPAIEPVSEVVEKRGTRLLRGTETVLFVDDEEAVLELGRSILERCGYTVLVARNGEEALEIYDARGEEISLVVLDLVMPKIDGRECLRRLLKMDPQARVLIATGYTADTSAQTLEREGAVGLVEKPYRLQELSQAVREALDADRK